jgi:hypothetical protein
MGYTEIDLKVAYYSDAVKQLPDGSHIANAEASRALDGEPFKYYPPDETKPAALDGVSLEEQDHYFSVFQYSEDWGLPHGGGWHNELPWVPPFLARMKYYKSLSEAYQIRRARG